MSDDRVDLSKTGGDHEPQSYGQPPEYRAPEPYTAGYAVPDAYGAAPAYGASDPYSTADPYGTPSPPSYGYGVAQPAPYSQTPYSQTPYSQTPYGQAPYGQPGYGQGAYGAGYGGSPYVARGTSGLSVAALVLGVSGLLFVGVTSIPAVICGHLGMRETRDGSRDGRGMAVAGLVLGYLQIALWVGFWALIFVGMGAGLA